MVQQPLLLQVLILRISNASAEQKHASMEATESALHFVKNINFFMVCVLLMHVVVISQQVRDEMS
ncbi:hypothetical protein YC2023_027792 [Brassica napus]